jgi:hypothetical protein
MVKFLKDGSLLKLNLGNPHLSIIDRETWLSQALLRAAVLLILQTPFSGAPRRFGLQTELGYLRRPADQMG